MKQQDLGLNLSTRRTRNFDLQTMLRIHFLQQWFGLSDLVVEEALFENVLYRQFAGLGNAQRIPDRVSIQRFRHLLDGHQLVPQMLATVNAALADRGLMLKQGTVVDTTLIAAPSSTKNQDGIRDLEMHQTKKGNQWYFGMKANIGIDANSGLVYTVVGTTANVNDLTQASQLVQDEESDVLGDARNQGKAKMAHPFRVIKRRFGYVKVHDRGLTKSMAHLQTLSELRNLWMTRKRILHGLQA